MKKIEIFVTNLGKYVEDELIGEWVTLPVTDEELAEVMKRIGINRQYEEYFITDYNLPFGNVHLSEYTRIKDFNDLAEQLDELDSWDEEKLAAILEYESAYSIGDIMDIIDHLDDFDLLTEVYTDRELGEYWADVCETIDEIPAHLQSYFDYEAFGRDIRFESLGGFTSYGFVMDNR